MISIRKGELDSHHVVDVSRIAELKTVDWENGLLRIGAAVTFTEITESPLLRDSAPVLAKACKTIGSTQIRNTGTLGGNVVNASPAADGIPPLVVHNAKVTVLSAGGSRHVAVEDFVTAPYRTSRRPNELVTGFLLEPVDAQWNHSFQRIARRKSLAVARINAAALGRLDSEEMVSEIRLCVGSVTPAPCRMTKAEQYMIGRRPDMALMEEAARLVAHEMVRQSGIRPTTEYKKPAVQGIVIKALAEVFGRGLP